MINNLVGYRNATNIFNSQQTIQYPGPDTHPPVVAKINFSKRGKGPLSSPQAIIVDTTPLREKK